MKPGKYQRRVLIEYLGMDQQQAADAVIASLLNAGFEQTDMSRLDDGRLRIGFRKNKHRIRVLVKNGGELRHAEARGLIRFDIPTKVSEAAQR